MIAEQMADVNAQHEVWRKWVQLDAKLALQQHAYDVLAGIEADTFVARVRQRYEQHRRLLIKNLDEDLAVRRDMYVQAADDEIYALEDLEWQVALLLYEAEDWTE